jgi:hypothetical protein
MARSKRFSARFFSRSPAWSMSIVIIPSPSLISAGFWLCPKRFQHSYLSIDQ